MKKYIKLKDYKSASPILIAVDEIAAIRQMTMGNHIKIFMNGGAAFDIDYKMNDLIRYLKGIGKDDE